jgi:uncharacterized membrane protein
MAGPPVVFAAGSHSAGFDLLLIGHVACALVGFGAVATSGVQAARLSRTGPAGAGEGLRRYFAPGTNWVGRVLFGVPLFGFALVADSAGRWSVGEGWVVIGLVLWALAAVIAEALLWPAERRIQWTLSAPSDATTGAAYPGDVQRDCLVVSGLGAALTVVFIAATVIMVAQP